LAGEDENVYGLVLGISRAEKAKESKNRTEAEANADGRLG